RLFRANGNAARKREARLAVCCSLERATGLEVEPRSRNDVVKKVVDEMRNTVHNLASLLLKTQRC
ncbi:MULTISPECIES: enoyl-CoA hydratase, partial [unclassified Burkholderia]|uniref:enoyl-CoA hydratase n=1 Tax=Burkholderia sp. LMG 13014 TaxID=2709306 RepID=UPI001965A799